MQTVRNGGRRTVRMHAKKNGKLRLLNTVTKKNMMSPNHDIIAHNNMNTVNTDNRTRVVNTDNIVVDTMDIYNSIIKVDTNDTNDTNYITTTNSSRPIIRIEYTPPPMLDETLEILKRNTVVKTTNPKSSHDLPENAQEILYDILYMASLKHTGVIPSGSFSYK
jgi:endo-alpha-1,4-polygalactosaminidase (GH114 family)